MKKLLNTSFIYAIAAMVCGVFYREMTKFSGFTGRTTLSFVHTHLFLLGMVFFLIAALFARDFDLWGEKRFGLFYRVYNAGLVVTAIMLLVRGVAQVRMLPLTRGADAAISGIAGIGHILLGVGIVLFFLTVRRLAADPAAKQGRARQQVR